ncbi:uncharacterized protein CLUP02_00932 [Colletotrichum lupini]|uniref:Uncharacterized protein n=1 Tax=Colletotrichum lupini TaxID=145971 RepID=A0A9Q8SBE2_9PEZI|nr:uncharacterized protein CLUP02_00932 [Colletotrichum lupini]UQC74284.1 hypothetical protein CLUP02_00932 [Colletotrichum lupini]
MVIHAKRMEYSYGEPVSLLCKKKTLNGSLGHFAFALWAWTTKTWPFGFIILVPLPVFYGARSQELGVTSASPIPQPQSQSVLVCRSPEWPPVISPFRAYSLVHRLHWPCGKNEADQTRHRHRDRGAGYPFHLLGPMAVSPVSSHQHPITRRACCPSTVDPFLRPISCPISSAGRSISPSAFDRRRALVAGAGLTNDWTRHLLLSHISVNNMRDRAPFIQSTSSIVSAHGLFRICSEPKRQWMEYRAPVGLIRAPSTYSSPRSLALTTHLWAMAPSVPNRSLAISAISPSHRPFRFPLSFAGSAKSAKCQEVPGSPLVRAYRALTEQRERALPIPLPPPPRRAAPLAARTSLQFSRSMGHGRMGGDRAVESESVFSQSSMNPHPSTDPKPESQHGGRLLMYAYSMVEAKQPQHRPSLCFGTAVDHDNGFDGPRPSSGCRIQCFLLHVHLTGNILSPADLVLGTQPTRRSWPGSFVHRGKNTGAADQQSEYLAMLWLECLINMRASSMRHWTFRFTVVTSHSQFDLRGDGESYICRHTVPSDNAK